MRIATQLIEAATGAHLWADHFDGSLTDVFQLQDHVATSVAGVIEPTLQAVETRRAAAYPIPDPTAYDLYLRALNMIIPVTKEGVLSGLALLEQAIAIDRLYGLALSWAAMCHRFLIINGWVDATKGDRTKAKNLACQALETGDNDPRVLVTAALVLAQFGEDIGAMIGLVDRALMLNPSFAQGWYLSGLIRVLAGEHDLAIQHINIARRLSPHERMGQSLRMIGIACFFKHRFDKAAEQLLLSIQDHPGSASAYRFLAACYAHMGQLEDARTIITRLLKITPEVVPSELPYRNPADRELLLAGLRLAVGEAR